MGDIYNIKMIGYMNKALDLRMARQNAIAANIAHSSTPGYKAVKVSFEESLNQAVGHSLGMRETNERHLPNGGAGVSGVQDINRHSGGVSRLDGNNVNIDREITDSAVNTTAYSALLAATGKYFGNLFAALEDRR